MLKTVNNKVMLEDEFYAFLKKLVQVVLPGLSTLYFALAAIWGLPDAKEVVGSIAAITTFFGVALHLSSSNYDASGAAFDGTASLIPNENGSALAMHLDPADVANKDKITLQVVPPTIQPPVQVPPVTQQPPSQPQ